MGAVSVRVMDFEDFCVPGEEWPHGDFFELLKSQSAKSNMFFKSKTWPVQLVT